MSELSNTVDVSSDRNLVEVSDDGNSITVTRSSNVVEVSAVGVQGAAGVVLWYKTPYTLDSNGQTQIPFLDADFWGTPSPSPDLAAAHPRYDINNFVGHRQSYDIDVVDDPESPFDGKFVAGATFSMRVFRYDPNKEIIYAFPGGPPLNSRTNSSSIRVGQSQDYGPTPLYVTSFGSGGSTATFGFGDAFTASDQSDKFSSAGAAIFGEAVVFARPYWFSELQQRVYDSHQLGIDGGTF